MKIANIFTGIGGLTASVEQIFRDVLGDVEITNIADDEILREVIKENSVTETLKNRVQALYKYATLANVDCIVCTCSSIGETIENVGIDVPVYRIDEPMARLAVDTGSKIGVLATLNSTIEPTCRLVEKIAKEKGKSVEITKCVAGEMMPLLKGGQMAEAIAMAKEKIAELSKTCDVIILAQASMAGMQAELESASTVAVYSSPKLCAENLKNILKK